jgi:tyrosine-protein phosphatase OCA6
MKHHQLVPPLRFRCIANDIYVGAYPTIQNFRFLHRLRLKTVVSLIPERPTNDLIEFCSYSVSNLPFYTPTLSNETISLFNNESITNEEDQSTENTSGEWIVNSNQTIHLIHFKVEQYKDSVQGLSFSDMSHIIELILNKRRAPLYIHCLDGRHVTSLVVMCLRKLQNWSHECSLRESRRFVPEWSNEDIDYVKQWKGPVTVPSEDADIPDWIWLPDRTSTEKHPRSIKLLNYFVEQRYDHRHRHASFSPTANPSLSSIVDTVMYHNVGNNDTHIKKQSNIDDLSSGISRSTSISGELCWGGSFSQDKIADVMSLQYGKDGLNKFILERSKDDRYVTKIGYAFPRSESDDSIKLHDSSSPPSNYNNSPPLLTYTLFGTRINLSGNYNSLPTIFSPRTDRIRIPWTNNKLRSLAPMSTKTYNRNKVIDDLSESPPQMKVDASGVSMANSGQAPTDDLMKIIKIEELPPFERVKLKKQLLWFYSTMNMNALNLEINEAEYLKKYGLKQHRLDIIHVSSLELDVETLEALDRLYERELELFNPANLTNIAPQ